MRVKEDPKKVYRVLSCVLYSLMNIYVWIDYLSCQSKNLRIISSNRKSKQKSFNTLLGIGIPYVLLGLISCNRFTEKLNSTVILNLRPCLVNNYLAKGFFIIENNSRQLSILPNDVKLRIHAIEQPETDFVLEKNTSISAVANTINKFHI